MRKGRARTNNLAFTATVQKRCSWDPALVSKQTLAENSARSRMTGLSRSAGLNSSERQVPALHPATPKYNESDNRIQIGSKPYGSSRTGQREQMPVNCLPDVLSRRRLPMFPPHHRRRRDSILAEFLQYSVSNFRGYVIDPGVPGLQLEETGSYLQVAEIGGLQTRIIRSGTVFRMQLSGTRQ